MTSPRLLFVDNDVNSFVAYRIELARAARAAGFEVHIASPVGKAIQTLTNEKFVFHPIRLSRSGLNLRAETDSILGLVRLYRQVQPQIVHHLRLKPVVYGGIAAYLARVPAVVGLLTGLGHVFTADTRKAHTCRRVIKAVCKCAFRHENQRIIFQNPDDCDVFVRGRFLPPEKVVLIRGSGVDVNVFRFTREPSGPPVVILPSRMLWDKGVAEFVAAATLLKTKGVQAKCVLVGGTDPDNPTAIDSTVLERWRATGVVDWWGQRHDMTAVFASSNIVCLPSYREGVPKSLIEAAACGRAIVATDVPGCREIVRHGINGLLVPVRDSESLAHGLELLIHNPSLRSCMGKMGRDLVTREFSIDQVITETLAVYDDLLPDFALAKRGQVLKSRGVGVAV